MDYKHYIEKLKLMPHPEGGYYRQVYGNDESGEKQISTIYYMLCGDEFSAFHKLHGMSEIWYYHAGECLDIYVIDVNGELVVHVHDGKIKVSKSNCPHQDCVNQGEVSDINHPIICAYNEVYIVINGNSNYDVEI